MKKTIIITTFFLINFCSFGQTDSTKTKLKLYTAIGVSIGHVDKNDESINNFNKASFPSVEIGVVGKNISLGACFGYENILATSTTRMFYELKTSVSKSISDKRCSNCVLSIGTPSLSIVNSRNGVFHKLRPFW